MTNAEYAVRNPAADERRAESAPREEPSAAESARAAGERLDEIHSYLADRARRREVVATTTTPLGMRIDWIPVESQMDGGAVAEPPGADRPVEAAAGERPAELTRFELELPGAEHGPPGTVPVVRRPIDRIRPSTALNDWLAKGPVARVVAPVDDPREVIVPGVNQHKYASTSQSVACYGTEGNINAWDPYVEWSDEFSLGQLGLSRGSGNGYQTLEVGQQAYNQLYGDWAPHLFVFFTTNGYTQQGDKKGGYNQDVDGWVQVASTVHPEALSSPVSVFGGAQYQLSLKVQLFAGNWWVRVNGTWMGYYPASLYNAGGLASSASAVNWFGEVVDSDGHAGTTATDMGNGHWPYEGFQHCAYMNNLRYQSATNGATADYNGAGYQSHPNCYGLETHMNSGTNWGSYLWWGGSGKNAKCP